MKLDSDLPVVGGWPFSGSSLGRGRPAGRTRVFPEELTERDAFGVLENPRRRRVLHDLVRSDERSTLSSLAERVAAWENSTDRESLTAAQRKRVYVALYQRHLPRMDEEGVVAFDSRSGEVVLTDRGRQLWRWQEQVTRSRGDSHHDWPNVYLGLCIAGLVTVTLGWVRLLSPLWCLTVLTVALCFTVGVHVRAGNGPVRGRHAG